MRLLQLLHERVRDAEAEERLSKEVIRDKRKRRELLARLRAIEMSLPPKYDKENPPSAHRR